MINVAYQRFDRLVRLFIPFLSSVFLVLLTAIPIYLPGFGDIPINVGLIAAFYWAIYRPDLFPAIAAFFLGLWQDILIGGPVGLYSIILLLTNWLIVSQRRFFQGKSFVIIWCSFSIVSLSTATLSWIIFCGLNVAFVSPIAVFFQAFLTIGAFPFVAWLLARVQHALLRTVYV